jgi:hypothetical protein
MVLYAGLSSIFRVHHGPRRWVFLPHAILFTFALLVGLAEGVELGLLAVYLVLVPVFTIQIILPTFAGWIVAFSGWLVFCALLVLDHSAIRLGATPGIDIWLLLAFVVLSSVPVYLLRPSAKLIGKAGKPLQPGKTAEDGT